ncbi:MAG TPA: amino acid adenylation domain-containing protein [Duganella sp.]|nr:amino acid adenylation domain-containing protein [Duganella sp.]
MTSIKNDEQQPAFLPDPMTSALPRLQEDAAGPDISSSGNGSNAALSWSQLRLWLLDRFVPESRVAYHLPASFRLTGTLDRTSLRRALDQVVARHEILRTVFTECDGEPRRQVVAAHVHFSLEERDLSNLEKDVREQVVRDARAAEAGAPFDLQRGPLIRGQLLRLAEDEHVLFITQHHIVSDAWSTTILMREVTTLYAAFTQGLPSPLVAVPAGCGDDPRDQQALTTPTEEDASLTFWREYLQHSPEFTTFPTDRPRPPSQSYRGDSADVTVPPALARDLRALAQRHGTSLYTVLLAAWAILLSRMSGQDDIVVGTPVANRQNLAYIDAVGFFVNTVAIRARFDADATVSQLVDQLKTDTMQVFGRQEVPLERVVEAVQPKRDLSRHVLFQTMLALDNTPAIESVSLPGLRLDVEPIPVLSTQFDVKLSLVDTGANLFGRIEYATDLFDASTVQRWIGHLLLICKAMVNDDQQRVGQIPLRTPLQRSTMHVLMKGKQVDYPRDLMIHQLFERQAAASPDGIALVFEQHELSYAQLNRRANQLAHYLISQGVGPDQRVALCAERGFEMVIALLAVLKAGAAYVPLDPAYPRERLDFMLADSAPVLLLTQQSLLGALDDVVVPVLVIDTASHLQTQPGHNPDPAVLGLHARHLAYVIYTSGSTGMPKGVMNQHDGVVNRLLWAQDQFALTADDRVLQKTPFGFDVSVWEFFLPLLAGARLVLARSGGHQDPLYLAKLIEDSAITTLHFVPSMLRSFVEQLAPGRCASIRHLLLSGEALPHPLVEEAARRLPRTQLHNLYGPTEAAIDVSYWNCTGMRTGPVPIGRPIANTGLYILDRFGQPVPIGAAGELHIGGVQVARGYLNRPELTAERFVTDPFSAEPDARMYKTGDLARWLADGNIEYLGRNDFQVKIRGFRIELGEIEARLAVCAGVREAVVLAREGAHGDKRLVAYLVAQDGVTLDAAALRVALGEVLPDYMIPSAFVALDSLPLTPNGKLDRGALPAPDQSALVTRAYAAPVGATDTALTEIWQDLLGVPRVGRHDHFFELGGHSLLAVQMAARVRQRLGVEIPLRELFAQPTLADYAGTMNKQTGVSQFAHVVTIRPTGETMPVFFVHAGGGEVAYVGDLEKWLDAAIPVYGLAATGLMPGQTPLTTVEDMASAYIKEMRLVQPKGPYRIAGWSAGGLIAYEIANQLIAADESVGFVGLLDASFNPNVKPEDIQRDFDPIKTLMQWVPENLATSSDIVAFQREGNVGGILAALQQAGLLASEIDEERVLRHLAVMHATRLAQLTYKAVAISVPITLFAAAETTAEFGAEQCHGWKEVAGENIHVVPVPGAHLTILEQPHIKALGQALSDALKNPPRDAEGHPEQQYQPRMTLNRGSGGVPPVFCVPGAGASITAFRDLVDTFDASLPVYGLQPRGMDGLLAPYLDVETAARAFVRSVREICPHGPYRLIGHSFGGWIVFEMALQLLRDGETISSLIILDSQAPSLHPEQKRRDTHVEIVRMLIDLYELNLGRSLGLSTEDLAPLDREQSISLLFSRLIAEKLLPPRTKKETLFAIFRVFEANVKARYVPGSVYEGPLHVASVRNDPEKEVPDQTGQSEPTWEAHAPRITSYEAQGNHLTMLSPPYVEKLGGWIMRALHHG